MVALVNRANCAVVVRQAETQSSASRIPTFG